MGRIETVRARRGASPAAAPGSPVSHEELALLARRLSAGPSPFLPGSALKGALRDVLAHIQQDSESATAEEGLQRANAALSASADELERTSRELGSFLASSAARADRIERTQSDIRATISSLQAI
ncbi:MAG: hypothetical protein JNK46_17220 [Methylobacteriaceae bacterium]|nr:hypothetical protein [Methylobacteriaceae bacterium]